MNNICAPSNLHPALQALTKAGMATPIGTNNEAGGCSALRINIAGNKIGTLITPTAITPLERVFRSFPVDGTLTATPEKNFSFELGTIDVPPQMNFVLLDTRFSIYVPTATGDNRELEDRRLSRQVGYDIRFNDTRTTNAQYQVDPSEPSLTSDTFSSGFNAGIIPGDGIGGVSDAEFQRLRTSNNGLGSASLSYQPQRRRRESQLDMPFTYLVDEGKRVNFDVQVFRQIPIPISFFEVEVAGFLIAKNEIKSFVDNIKPCISVGSI